MAWSKVFGSCFAGLTELRIHPTTCGCLCHMGHSNSIAHTSISQGHDLPWSGKTNPTSPLLVPMPWLRMFPRQDVIPKTTSTVELMEWIITRCLQGYRSNEANHAGKPTDFKVCRFRCIKSAKSVTFILPLKEPQR